MQTTLETIEMRATTATSDRVTILPRQLGADTFRRRYRIKYAYLTGAMYRGIASKELVVAIGKAGLMGFLGTGGRSMDEIEGDIRFIQRQLEAEQVYGMNLICDPQDPRNEESAVELYLRCGVTCIEAAAFTRMTSALVYYRVSGLHEGHDGRIVCRHKVVAKVSRPEVAEAFLSAPPADVVGKLLAEGRISREQAGLAAEIAMSDDLCVEADSGGHTDRGNATVLLPAIQQLKNEMARGRRNKDPIHIGLAGGIGTPQAAAAAFMMGADFILTGSINQCTVEAGTSDVVKDLLQRINVQDTDYAPAGDMFEQGARVQVLRKGVLFPARANKLYALYHHHDAWEEIPARVRTQIETTYFQRSFEQVWREVQEHHHHKGRSATLERAATDRKHKMALVFRWYFAYSARLALAGDEKNQVDFQVHTGPALGAFNQWVRGSELESWRKRHVALVAEKLMQETAQLLDRQINELIQANHSTAEIEK